MTNAQLAIQLLLATLTQSQAIGQLLATAQSSGVDITDAQLDALSTAFDSANAKLTADIAAARTA